MILESLFILLSLLSLAQPEVLRRATAAIQDGNGEQLGKVLIFAAVTAVVGIVLSFLRDICKADTSNRYQQQLSGNLLDKVLSARMEALSGRQFGDISTVFTRNVERFVNAALESILLLSTGIFSLALVFIYMCLVEWRLACCVLVYNLIIRFFAVFVERKMKRNEEELTDSLKKSSNLLVSLLENMLLVRIYSNRDFFQKRFAAREREVWHTGWKNFVWQNGFQDFIWAFSKLAEFVIVYGVGAVLILRGQTDISILLAFVFVNDLFTIGINNLSYYMVNRAQAEACLDSLTEILELPGEPEKAVHLDRESAPADSAAPIAVRFQDVTFSYGEGLAPVLENVSFEIRAGERIQLAGPNGQGKSTLLKLIAGLYHPQQGHIFYDDGSGDGWNEGVRQEDMAYISQHSNILEGNVCENLAVSHQVDRKRAECVLKELQLSAVVDNPPENLSMGEQQRLNIGRSLYRGERGIVLCDEIFSNVDQVNRERIKRQLTEFCRTATVIMITHEDVGMEFDRVLEVSGGKVRVSGYER